MARPEHIVDILIAERAPHLRASPLWPLAKPVLYGLLDYGQARRLADAVAPMSGREAMAHVSALLALKIEVVGLDRLPAAGRAIVACNHPTGLADGVAAYDAIAPRRGDLCFFANSDAHRVAPRFDDLLIPVEWVEAKRTRERTRLTLRMAQAALEAERAPIIFPAGRLAARDRRGRLREQPWLATPVSLARRHDAPITPIHLSGPQSRLFHAFDGRSRELRDITLFHELLNKRGGAFTLIVGPPVPAGALRGDPQDLIDRLKTYVEQVLPQHPDQAFA